MIRRFFLIISAQNIFTYTAKHKSMNLEEMNMKKKLIALVLSLVMVIGLVPAAAVADGA